MIDLLTSKEYVSKKDNQLMDLLVKIMTLVTGYNEAYPNWYLSTPEQINSTVTTIYYMMTEITMLSSFQEYGIEEVRVALERLTQERVRSLSPEQMKGFVEPFLARIFHYGAHITATRGTEESKLLFAAASAAAETALPGSKDTAAAMFASGVLPDFFAGEALVAGANAIEDLPEAMAVAVAAAVAANAIEILPAEVLAAAVAANVIEILPAEPIAVPIPVRFTSVCLSVITGVLPYMILMATSDFFAAAIVEYILQEKHDSPDDDDSASDSDSSGF